MGTGFCIELVQPAGSIKVEFAHIEGLLQGCDRQVKRIGSAIREHSSQMTLRGLQAFQHTVVPVDGAALNGYESKVHILPLPRYLDLVKMKHAPVAEPFDEFQQYGTFHISFQKTRRKEGGSGGIAENKGLAFRLQLHQGFAHTGNFRNGSLLVKMPDSGRKHRIGFTDQKHILVGGPALRWDINCLKAKQFSISNKIGDSLRRSL